MYSEQIIYFSRDCTHYHMQSAVYKIVPCITSSCLGRPSPGVWREGWQDWLTFTNCYFKKIRRQYFWGISTDMHTVDKCCNCRGFAEGGAGGLEGILAPSQKYWERLRPGFIRALFLNPACGAVPTGVARPAATGENYARRSFGHARVPNLRPPHLLVLAARPLITGRKGTVHW